MKSHPVEMRTHKNTRLVFQADASNVVKKEENEKSKKSKREGSRMKQERVDWVATS